MNTKGLQLYQQLKELNIVTGKIGSNELEPWFCSVDKNTLNFVEWFQDNITQENVLTCSETTAKEDLCEKKLFLEGPRFEVTKREIETKYPGIFDTETNAFECELLKEEEKMLEDEVEYLKTSIALVNQRNKELKKTKADKTNECMHVDFKRNEAASKCLQYAEDLDHSNENIAQQLSVCWLTLPPSTIPSFFTQIPFKPHNDYINSFHFEVVNMFKDDFDKIHGLQQSVHPNMTANIQDNFDETIFNNSAYENSSDKISSRLIKSYAKKINNLLKVEATQGKINFLLDVDALGINGAHVFNKQQQQLVNTRNVSVKQIEVQEAVLRRVRTYIKLPTIVLAGKELGAINIKLTFYTNFETIFKQILQYQLLLRQLLSTEISVCHQLKNFHAYIRGYINNELFTCESHSAAMNSTISMCNDTLSLPFERKWHPLKTILRIIDVDSANLTFIEALDSIQAFNFNCNALEHKVFVDEIDNFRIGLNKVDKRNKALKTFLSSNSTNQLSVMPYKIYEVLANSNEAIETQNKIIKFYRSLPKETAVKIERNKWLKYKRQLWMYFLKNPQKMEMILDELENEIRKTRAKYLIN